MTATAQSPYRPSARGSDAIRRPCPHSAPASILGAAWLSCLSGTAHFSPVRLRLIVRRRAGGPSSGLAGPGGVRFDGGTGTARAHRQGPARAGDQDSPAQGLCPGRYPRRCPDAVPWTGVPLRGRPPGVGSGPSLPGSAADLAGHRRQVRGARPSAPGHRPQAIGPENRVPRTHTPRQVLVCRNSPMSKPSARCWPPAVRVGASGGSRCGTPPCCTGWVRGGSYGSWRTGGCGPRGGMGSGCSAGRTGPRSPSTSA
ncbi:hypothetical protein DUI70_6562 [Streptomyces albus]|nr:hypothetical protein DUI70_6562 [Streptomyces albus]